MKNINLFVYGSLREGFFNYDNYLTGKVEQIKKAKLSKKNLYHMPYKGYPAIIAGDDDIFGEIIVIRDEDYATTMKAIDELEGFYGEGHSENEYHKMLLEVEDIETQEKEYCFVYVYNKDVDQLFESNAVNIPDGDWKKYMCK